MVDQSTTNTTQQQQSTVTATSATATDSITLANVHQYLDGDGIFLPEDDTDGPTSHEIDAAIHNASNSLLEHDSSAIDATLHDTHFHQDEDVMIDPSLMVEDEKTNEDYTTTARNIKTDNTTLHRQAKRRMLSDEAIRNPVAHIAPFLKPQRGNDTPHPEQLVFKARDDFEEWLNGESSWCHYVQRRVTNPEKRAEERLKARLKAHERTLSAMTPEDAAAAPPLKRRRRNRTSAVIEKITYTCHHAGNYSSKHSEDLPITKLRMNTKQSVKCSCSSRIVLTEVEGGECQVMYYWKHEGHDPFATESLESGRLPKVVDDWLNDQIRSGESVESIRRKLDMRPDLRDDYINKSNEDPSFVDPDLPPPLAFSVKIKYPDVYNRWRKLRGPLKEGKTAKSYGKSTRKPRSRPSGEDLQTEPTLAAVGMSHKLEHPSHLHAQGEPSGSGSRERSLVMETDSQIDPELQTEEGPSMLQSEDVDHQFDEHLARLASDGQLAEALLQLPQGTNEGDSSAGQGHDQPIGVDSHAGLEVGQPQEHDDEENLREAVLRMARAEREDWDSIVQS